MATSVRQKLFRTRDTMTREMVKDLAKEGATQEVEHALNGYGKWLELHEDAWEYLGVPKPTNRVFSTAR